MQKFDLSLWLQDKSRKVVTRDGRPVRIVCWDLLGEYKIIAVTDESDEGYTIINKKVDGTGGVSTNDLFFADEEKLNRIIDELKSYLEKTPKEQVEKDWKEIQDWYAQHFTNENHNEKEELTEFEKAIYQYICTIVAACDGVVYGDKELKPIVKEIAKELIDLAIKEIRKEQQEKLGTLEMPIDVTEPYYIKGKQDALKDLPKWKKATKCKEFDKHVCVMDYYTFPFLDTEVNEGDYYIKLEDLKTLPKEE